MNKLIVIVILLAFATVAFVLEGWVVATILTALGKPVSVGIGTLIVLVLDTLLGARIRATK